MNLFIFNKKMYSILRKEIQPEECNSFHLRYLNQLSPNIDLVPAFEKSKSDTYTFYAQLPEEKRTYRYDEGKWSIKEVLQHIIDTERIFMYRCFRIGRRDSTPLAGFEQDDYIIPSGAHSKVYEALLEEFNSTRTYSLSILNSFQKEDLSFIGTASGFPISARAAAFLVLGHEIWHKNIVKERYL